MYRFLANLRWGLLASGVASVLAAASLLAYFDALPAFLNKIPYHDIVAHFVLLFLLSLSATMTFPTIPWRRGSFSFPTGAGLVGTVSVVDELAQIGSVHRTFSYEDLCANLAGVLCGWVAAKFLASRILKYRRAS